MWLLILTLLWLNNPETNQKEYTILIVDDCTNWNEIVRPSSTTFYSITKEVPVFNHVRLSHFWLFPEDSLTKIRMRYSEILNKNPRYTSKLTTEDLSQLAYGKDKKKVFILRPIDYCSSKRFAFNQEFTLYEVRIGLSGDE
jgi:hypothetical protein